MFTTLIFFLPCLVTLLWLFIFALKKKTYRQRFFSWMLVVETFYFATYAVYVYPHADYDLMVKMDAVCIPLILVMLSMMMIYLRMHKEGNKYNPLYLFLFAPAALFAGIVWLLYYVLGFDYTARLAEAFDNGTLSAEFDNQLTRIYGFFVIDAISIVITIYFLQIVWQCCSLLKAGGYRFGNVTRFFFSGLQSSPSRVIAVLYIALCLLIMPLNSMGRTWMMYHAVLSGIVAVLLAIVKHFICHVEFYSHSKLVTFNTLTHVMPEEEIVLQEEEVEEEIIAEKAAKAAESSTSEVGDLPNNAGTIKSDLLLEKFQRLLEVDKIYRDDSINMSTIAEQLEVGRTTLSNMVNMHYGMPFRDLLNHYRIEAAKQYLLENPAATQEEVALECGFKDASSLNRKFKELEGETPLMWLTQHNTSAS